MLRLTLRCGRRQTLEEDNDNFRRALGRYAISECGELPHPDLDITYLKSQIWYSPWLTEAEKRTKSIWSPRFSVDVRHHRLPEEINVRLFPIKQFYKSAKRPAMQTESVMERAGGIPRSCRRGHLADGDAGEAHTYPLRQVLPSQRRAAGQRRQGISALVVRVEANQRSERMRGILMHLFYASSFYESSMKMHKDGGAKASHGPCTSSV